MSPVRHLTLPQSGLRLLIVIAVAAAAGFPFPVPAQVNIEALRQDDPPLGYSGTFGGDLTVRTGNVELIQIALNARVYRATESVTRLMVGNGGLGLQGGGHDVAMREYRTLRQSGRAARVLQEGD